MSGVRIVSVDANIGAGKSTLLGALADAGHRVLPEGVDSGGWGGLLPRFYADPARWALTLQVAIGLDMARQRAEIGRLGGTVFVERGPHSARCFARNSARAGHMDDEETNVFDDMNAVCGWTPDILVVIDLDVDTCLRRIRQRGRRGESTVDRAYLVAIDAEYATMVAEMEARGVEVVHVDGRLTPRALARAVGALAFRKREPLVDGLDQGPVKKACSQKS